MILVLDTSILIDIERKREETIEKLEELSKRYPSPARITFISEFELMVGIKEQVQKKQEQTISFLNKFTKIQTSEKTAEILANLKYKYDKKGIVIPLADLLIATLVIENNFYLITKDEDFSKIEELNKAILR
ncbi:type II toxin-antitoxin system VapC family toxin [Candidatus Woesearchaeota archaeon]|nr:type II toxin-antitoxin system VapC family toxin [Candidatus Woesearchaeota archaeon]